MFDHNQALLPYAEQEDFQNLDLYLASRPTQIGEDFNEIANALLTSEIRSDLKNLRGFKFEKNGEFDLPEGVLFPVSYCLSGISKNFIIS